MRKKFVFLLSVALISLPASAFAFISCQETDKGCTLEQLVQLDKDSVSVGLSTTERIAILQQIVAKLSSQISKSPSVSNSSSCLDIQSDLYLGKTDSGTNGEVSKLQRFLITGGFYPEARVSGFYGSLTAQAVVRWQKAHGMNFVTTKSGVGQGTRAKLACSLAESVAPVIGSITPASGPVGTAVAIAGSGLTGFEGDIIFTFEKSDGSKARLGGTTGTKVSLVIKEPCKLGEMYYPAEDASGIPKLCNYVALTPGIYKVYTGTSNAVAFTITP